MECFSAAKVTTQPGIHAAERYRQDCLHMYSPQAHKKLSKLNDIMICSIVKRTDGAVGFQQRQSGNIFNGDYLLKREMPVICLGFSMPIRARRVGATSAKPPSLNLVPVFKPSWSDA